MLGNSKENTFTWIEQNGPAADTSNKEDPANVKLILRHIKSNDQDLRSAYVFCWNQLDLKVLTFGRIMAII